MNRFLGFFQDPGILFAIANAFLFFKNSTLAFFIVIGATALILFLKLYAHRQPYEAAEHNLLIAFGQKKFMGLEIIGYSCFFVAFIAMTQQLFLDFISSFCFGFSSLLFAYRLSPYTSTQQQDWKLISKDIRSIVSLTPLFIALLMEPIFLVCLGLVHAGLAAGHESLWILPILCWIPYLTICKPNLNRVIPLSCLCICALWFTCVAISHHEWKLVISNLLCAVAYLEIALQEHRLFLSKH